MKTILKENVFCLSFYHSYFNKAKEVIKDYFYVSFYDFRKRSYERAPSPKFIVTLDGTGVPPNKVKKQANMDILTSSIIQRSTQNTGILFSAEPDSNSRSNINLIVLRKRSLGRT